MPAMTADIRLLQFSDPHLSSRADAMLRGVVTRPALETVLRHARAQHSNVDALLLTGDLVNDDAGGYAGVRELFGAFGKPVYCLPGNHDDPALMQQELRAAPFQVGGHADLGAWRLIMLDSCVPGKAHGRLSAAELQRLAASLDGAGERHVLICLHHHPVRQGSRWLDSVCLQNADEFFAVTDRSQAVRAMVWGHVHQQFESRRKGVRLLSVPSTCAQFLPHADQFALDPSPPGYRRLTLCQDGSIDTEVVRVPLRTKAGLNQRAAGA
jgi:3',5'-cyclic-AMP phosphodiesterase